jgi:hypothetical protein
MSSINQSVTPGFIDLATYDELEKYMYGGSDATTYFVCSHKTATWFTLIPTVLTNSMGVAGFNTEWAASISRAGDYLVHTWLRATLPQINFAVNDGKQVVGRWTHNVAHNLIKECAVTFNDLIAARFDNYFLDFWAAFCVPASKQVGYNNMIGNVPELTSACSTLYPYTVNLPLPFFFTRDTGIALPTAALPYNEMRIQFQMRDYTDLLVVYPNGTSPGRPVAQGDLVLTNGSPVLKNAYVWAEYALVSNDERKRMGCAPRDMLIEQVQTAPRATFTPAKDINNVQVNASSTDIRFSHAVKALLFSVRNSTVRSEWSNYTVGNIATSGEPLLPFDPMSNATLLYENTQRLAGLPADYYSLVEPWHKAPTIPANTGYHMYSYAINMYDINPLGSTNYGKLTNVTLDLSSQIPPPTDNGTSAVTYTYETIICAINHNVIRISGGALGFPVL